MLYRYLLSIICISFVFKSAAQHPLDMDRYADSLYNALQVTDNDSVRATIYFNLSGYWLAKDTTKAKAYLEQIHFQTKQNPYFEGLYYARKGYFSYYFQDFESSKKYYLKADNILNKLHYKDANTILADVWNNLGIIEQIQNNDVVYIDYLINKAIPYAKKANDLGRLASYYNGIGVAFMNIDQNEKAIQYFNEAETSLLSMTNQSFRLVSLYNRITENLLILNRLQEAKAYLDKNELLIKDHEASEQYALYLLSRGFYNFKLNNYDQAIHYYNQGINAATGPNKIYHIHELNLYKIKALMAVKNYDAALQIAKKLEADILFMETQQNELEIYDQLHQIYKFKNQLPQAYLYLNKYTQLNQTLFSQDYQKQINQLEAKYNNETKVQELIKLKEQQKVTALKVKESRLLIALSILGMLLFLLLTIIIYVVTTNKKKLLEQKITVVEKNKKIGITNAILEGQEKERERIAKELHDGLGGTLSGISLKFSAWESKYVMTTNADSFNKIKQELDQAITNLRAISRNLMPEILLKYGLQTALNDLCAFFESETIHIDFQAINLENDVLDKNIELNIYRIIQELLGNAIKHAQASQILLQCTRDQDLLLITIEDDGIGYHPEAIRTGMGLPNIQNRVAYLNGRIDVESAPNLGTQINIELSLTKNN